MVFFWLSILKNHYFLKLKRIQNKKGAKKKTPQRLPCNNNAYQFLVTNQDKRIQTHHCSLSFYIYIPISTLPSLFHYYNYGYRDCQGSHRSSSDRYRTRRRFGQKLEVEEGSTMDEAVDNQRSNGEYHYWKCLQCDSHEIESYYWACP